MSNNCEKFKFYMILMPMLEEIEVALSKVSEERGITLFYGEITKSYEEEIVMMAREGTLDNQSIVGHMSRELYSA